jgi:hypothetical protein
MENITRIADLPDNPNGPGLQNTFNPNAQQPPVTNGYTPINLHPNPYGISAQNPIMPPPQQQLPTQQQVPMQMPPQYISEEQKMQIQSLQQQRLPSRDIPSDQAGYNHDEQITPNYIPKAKQEKDYVRDYEDMTEKNLKEYEDKNRKEKKLDIILTELQIPIFISILFFFFQLPIINTLVFKRFVFLSIYNSDGNFNFSGLVFKSILFGLFYYFTLKFTNFLAEF